MDLRRQYQKKVYLLDLLRQKIGRGDPVVERSDGADGHVYRQIRRFEMVNGLEGENRELLAAGVNPADIDDIVITHIHQDERDLFRLQQDFRWGSALIIW